MEITNWEILQSAVCIMTWCLKKSRPVFWSQKPLCASALAGGGGGVVSICSLKSFKTRPSKSRAKKGKLDSTSLMILDQNPPTHSPRRSIQKFHKVHTHPPCTTGIRIQPNFASHHPCSVNRARDASTSCKSWVLCAPRLLVGPEPSSRPNSWPSHYRSNRDVVG